jgi:tetratricopeptide (TPR) repeat protein
MINRPLDEEAIFHIARRIGDHQLRADYLEQVCGDNTALLTRMQALLEVHEKESEFLRSRGPEPTATLDAAPITEAPGTEIGRYRLMEQIGEGGMGVVFVAEQRQPLRRKVALKVIKPGLDSKAVVARFEAERQALALMDHPNIAHVLDAGSTAAGRPYFVMEYVRGEPITKYCDKNKLTVRERVDLFIPVCHAIQHAHQKGIVHRDIKPSNVLVTLHDGVPVPKVIDFGVAKALHTRLTDRTIYTAHMQVIGTLMYMSPEQAELSGLDVDTRADVYGLGVLLYELLTGTTPFLKQDLDRAGFDEQRRIIREQEPPRASLRISSLGETATTVAQHRNTDPRKLHQQLRGDLDWIVMKALEKDRTRRYETANGFAADVQRFLANEPIEARPPSAAYRLGKVASRHRTVLAAVTVVMMVLLGAAATSTWQWRHADELMRKYKETALSLQTELVDRAINAAFNGELEPALAAIRLARTVELSEPVAQVLEGIAYFTAGKMKEAVERIEKQEAEGNYLATAVLVWVYYESDHIGKMEHLSESLLVGQESRAAAAESDLERVLLARLSTHEPGDAHDQAIDALSKVIERHRFWGFAYYARAEAYRDKFSATKKITDLRAALEDDRIARFCLPHSEVVKTASLELHLHAYQYAEASGEIVDEIHRNEWRNYAQELADHFASRLSTWNGAAHALAFYRATKQDTLADALEARIEKEFAHLQPIRDAKWFETRDYESFERELSTANPFTKHLYALALFERGDREQALEVLDETLERSKQNSDALVSAVEILQLIGEFDRSRELAREYLEAGKGLDLWEWTVFVLEYLAGDKSEEELRELAHPFHSLVCFSRHLVGSSHRARGDRETAKEHFQAVLDTGRIGWGAYERSKVYLKRLEQNPNWLAR